MENYSNDDLFQFKRRSTMSKPPRAPSNTAECHRSDVENMAEEHQRNGRTSSEPLQAVDTEQQEVTSRRKPVLVRSKTFDHSLLTQIQPDLDSKIERKKSQYSQLSKSNSHYHKIFKEISKEEQLRQSYTCALQKDILYQGRMFVSDHWICFHSKVFGKDTKIAIPVISVTHIKKTKTAILVPNALVISTANDRYVFVSFLSRDNTYKLLMSLCLHLEEKSPCSSPIPSSAENSFRGQRSPGSPRFPLSFSGDFSDLDGAVRQRRQEMEESSSSDSQTPDYEKIAAHRRCSSSRTSRPSAQSEETSEPAESRQQAALRNDFLRESADVNTELFSELLTINLMKLEKVQKNLQRLLDEAA
ncbi:hypothetical protein PAMP_021756 [Pampus punctatissimus]